MSRLISSSHSFRQSASWLGRQYAAHQTRPAPSRGEGAPQLSVVPGEPEQSEFAAGTYEDDQWQERALCAQTDPEALLPGEGWLDPRGQAHLLGLRGARRCLDYALADDERFGIGGGLSERERRRLKRGII